MSGNTNSGSGSGELHRTALLSLLEVYTEGATVTELSVYVGRTRPATRNQLRILQSQGKVTQSEDKLWHLTSAEADRRSAHLQRAPHVLPPQRVKARGRR